MIGPSNHCGHLNNKIVTAYSNCPEKPLKLAVTYINHVFCLIVDGVTSAALEKAASVTSLHSPDGDVTKSIGGDGCVDGLFSAGVVAPLPRPPTVYYRVSDTRQHASNRFQQRDGSTRVHAVTFLPEVGQLPDKESSVIAAAGRPLPDRKPRSAHARRRTSDAAAAAVNAKPRRNSLTSSGDLSENLLLATELHRPASVDTCNLIADSSPAAENLEGVDSGSEMKWETSSPASDDGLKPGFKPVSSASRGLSEEVAGCGKDENGRLADDGRLSVDVSADLPSNVTGIAGGEKERTMLAPEAVARRSRRVSSIVTGKADNLSI